jgi:DNA-binding SARP family transcriptional activator
VTALPLAAGVESLLASAPLHPHAGRRLTGPPRPVAGELVRNRLLDALAGRWDVPVTVVLAGAGFGKSTLLGQALRLHDAEPRGIEAWLGCEPGDEDAQRLAGAICAALGRHPGAGSPVATVLEALRATSPVDTCLVVDDVHELPPGSAGASLLADVVRRLPAHAHLVLAGRSMPGLPLARLRAADLLVELGEAELAFTPAESAVLAGRAGRPAATVARLAGWPALVRLTLAAPAGVARDFLWEEVVHRLPAADRRLLLVLALLGAADRRTLVELCPEVPDPAGLADRVPLVDRSGADRLRVHPLWMDALTRLLPADAVRAASGTIGALLLAREDVLRAGSVACAAGDADLLEEAALGLVRSTLATFPADTGARWLAAAPPGRRGRPRLLLLEAAVRQARNARDSTVDAVLTGAVAAARVGGDTEAAAAGLSLATVAAHARGDGPWLLQVHQLAATLPDLEREPTLRLLDAAVTAALAELRGDLDSALAALRALDAGDAPVAANEATSRFHVDLLLLAGEAGAAAALAGARLGDSTQAYVRRAPSVARWLAGEPESLLADPWPVTVDETDDRAQFNHLVFSTVILASIGDRARLDGFWTALDRTALGRGTREATMLAVAAAARSVVGHDEPAAVRVIEEHLAAHPLTDPVSNLQLRRFLAIGYLLSPEARRAWDAQPLGRSHRQVRQAARQLLAARRGRLRPDDELPPAGLAFTALPLPWSVELAARARAAGHPSAGRLAEQLARYAGAAAHEELCRLAAQGRGPAAQGARQLLATVTRPPASVTGIEVLGPLRLLVDGVEVQPAELRRTRVRELLAVLAVRGSATRDQLMDLLWPDLPPADAAGNLRVTLSYLRRALEPDRPPGTPSHHLRVDRDSVGLVRSTHLQIDFADLREHLAPSAARSAGADPDRGLVAAVALWRGEPLADLARLPAFAADVAEVRMLLVEAALTLGERRLAEGDTAEALRLAERVLAADDVAERGLRLLLAARLHRGEPVAIAAAVRRVEAALADLGVRPEPATAMLLRQARIRLAPQSHTGSGMHAAGRRRPA